MSKDLKYFASQAEKRNNDVYWYNYRRLQNKAIAMFEWKNLPKEIDERYLEMILFNQGYICFFKDKIADTDTYFALQCTLGGRFNVYNIPTQYQIYTASGYTAKRNKDDSVIIWNNFLHTPTAPICMHYAELISNVERTIETNLNQLKRPYIFLVPENQRLTFKKLIADIKNNEDVVVGSDQLTIDTINNLNTISPNNTLDLYTLKKKYYGEGLTDLGIDNFQSEKKERMVTGEVSANEEDVTINRYSMLYARKQACKQINEMFGLDIDVDFRYDIYRDKDFENEVDQLSIHDNEGGVVNG